MSAPNGVSPSTTAKLDIAMVGKSAARVFRFGRFEADEATGELRKRGLRLKLHSQPFQVLLVLLERPSELVTREELRQRLWQADTFVDFDHGLNTAVNKLRQTLGDSASQPTYVETIPGKGYRFISPVTCAEPILESPQPPTAGSAIEAEAQLPASSPPSPANTLLTRLAAKRRLVNTREKSPLGLAPSRRAGVAGRLLTGPHELPRAPRKLVAGLLLLVQAMYLAFYLGALANLKEIYDIFSDARLLSPDILVTVVAITAAGTIPIRLFIAAAVAFGYQQLSIKFSKLFPVLLPVDILWAMSPFLLIHHLNAGLALGMTAALLYVPFAQRSLILMYTQKN